MFWLGTLFSYYVVICVVEIHMERYVLGSREYKQTIVKDPASTYWCNSQCVSCFVGACIGNSNILCII